MAVHNANDTGSSPQVQCPIGSAGGAVLFRRANDPRFLRILCAFFCFKAPVKTAELTILGTPFQTGIQYVPLLNFNVSCIDRRRFPVEITPSSAAPDGLGLVGPGSRYGSEVLATLNDSSAGDLPIERILDQNTAIPNQITVLSAGRMTPRRRILGK